MTRPLYRLVSSFALPLALLAPACTSSEATPPDAPAAMPMPDAPSAAVIKGLGQHCGPNLPACPATMFCPPESEPAHAYCTPTCWADTFTTDEEGSIVDLPEPSSGDAVCHLAYSAGAPGTPVCAAAYHLTPSAPLEPSTEYTVDFLCTIQCNATRQCPAGLQCSADGDCTP